MPHEDKPGSSPETSRTTFGKMTMTVFVLVVIAAVLAMVWIGPALAIERIASAI